MKMTIEVDCTPEEARRFMGLPDVSALNDHMVAEMTKRIDANINMLKVKSISLHWEMMFTRSQFNTPDMLAQNHLLTEVAHLIDAGVIRSTFGENFGRVNADNLKRAHALLESGKARGKIVLEGF